MGLAHGILAGNPAGSTLADFQPCAVLFTWNLGSICLLLAILLGCTYLLHRKLPRLWMPLHRLATVALLICLVLHIADVGITLPSRILSRNETIASAALPSENENTAQADASTPQTGDVPTANVTFSGAELADGTYTGAADGYNGTITVSVVVADGQVTAINVDSESDTERFFIQAESVLDEITENQSLAVDTVTGATFSSAGLLNAVYNALQDAVVSGTLQKTNIDLSSVQRHGRK